MSKKVLTIRLPESKHQQLIGKIGDNSINGIFERLTDLIINETIIINPQGISFRQQSDSNMIADNQSYQSDSNLTALTEVEGIKKQIDCIMTALELKGNHSNRLDSIEDKVKQIDSNLTALANRQHCDCKIIADKNKQQDDSQLNLLFDEVVEIPEKLKNINRTESEGINEDNNEHLPSNIESQETIKNEDTITPKTENDRLKNDSEGAKSSNKKKKKNILKPLPQSFLDLPTGIHTAKVLNYALGYKTKTGSMMNRFANGTNNPPFECFWDYLKVEKSIETGKYVWEKTK